MSKEIIAAVRELEEAKGIDGEVLLTALEDALLVGGFLNSLLRQSDRVRVGLTTHAVGGLSDVDVEPVGPPWQMTNRGGRSAALASQSGFCGR